MSEPQREYDRIQKVITKQKKRVYNGEMRSCDYYAYLTGLLTSELSAYLGRHLDTNLDLEKIEN